MKYLTIILSLSLLVAVFNSCAGQRPDSDNPVAAYEAFYRAAAEGQWATIYHLLDSRSRRCLGRAAELLAGQAGAVSDSEAFYLQQLQGQRQSPLREIRLVSQEGDRAEVETAAGSCDREENCVRRRVRLVRETGRWLVSPEFKRPLVNLWGKEEC